MTFADKLFSFKGRLRRQDFWLLTLVLWGVWFAASTVLVTTMRLTGLHLYYLYGALFLIIAWPHLAVGAKRLHDSDQSGWMILLFFLPVIGWVFWLVSLGILDGTPGPNRFGPSPKGLGKTELLP